MRKYKQFSNLKFDPADYNLVEISKLSHLLRHDPEEVRRKIQSGEWTAGDLEKAIEYLEEYEKDVKKRNPMWEPRHDAMNLRAHYKDILIRII